MLKLVKEFSPWSCNIKKVCETVCCHFLLSKMYFLFLFLYYCLFLVNDVFIGRFCQWKQLLGIHSSGQLSAARVSKETHAEILILVYLGAFMYTVYALR